MLNAYGDALWRRLTGAVQAPVPLGVRYRYDSVLFPFASFVYGALTASASQVPAAGVTVAVPAAVEFTGANISRLMPVIEAYVFPELGVCADVSVDAPVGITLCEM